MIPFRGNIPKRQIHRVRKQISGWPRGDGENKWGLTANGYGISFRGWRKCSKIDLEYIKPLFIKLWFWRKWEEHWIQHQKTWFGSTNHWFVQWHILQTFLFCFLHLTEWSYHSSTQLVKLKTHKPPEKHTSQSVTSWANQSSSLRFYSFDLLKYLSSPFLNLLPLADISAHLDYYNSLL